jgi:hypothetical protein
MQKFVEIEYYSDVNILYRSSFNTDLVPFIDSPRLDGSGMFLVIVLYNQMFSNLYFKTQEEAESAYDLLREKIAPNPTI